jgi:hypothetical protein
MKKYVFLFSNEHSSIEKQIEAGGMTEAMNQALRFQRKLKFDKQCDISIEFKGIVYTSI